MTSWQRAIKYIAIVFASFLCISIFGAIAGTLSLFIPTHTKTAKSPADYSAKSDIYQMNIDVDSSNIEIVTGDEFKVSSNVKGLDIKESSNSLRIKESGFIFNKKSDKDTKVTIFVPKNMQFESVTVDGGLGSIKIDSLIAESLDIDLGAGTFSADNLTAYKNASIDSGAGEFTVKDGILNNLDFDMGTGKTEIRSNFKGECSFDLGVGKTAINVIGNKNDYELDIEKGLGKVTLDNETVYSDFTAGKHTANQIEIDCGIGNTDIVFEEK